MGITIRCLMAVSVKSAELYGENGGLHMSVTRNCLHCLNENPNPHRAICAYCSKCHCDFWGSGRETRKREIRKRYGYKVKNILEAER